MNFSLRLSLPRNNFGCFLMGLATTAGPVSLIAMLKVRKVRRVNHSSDISGSPPINWTLSTPAYQE